MKILKVILSFLIFLFPIFSFAYEGDQRVRDLDL